MPNESKHSTQQTRALPTLFRLLILGIVLMVAGLLASTAYTRDHVSGRVNYICEDGDRFTVDYQASHIRLRHGTGVFALAANERKAEYASYSGGDLTFIDNGESVTFERTALESRQECMVAKTS